jgi:glycerol-3-phosphate acyltransferase PlsY
MGAIPMGYLVAKWVYQKDITSEGSGNTGGTNVMRLCGKPAGFAVYFLDFTKAFVPVWLIMNTLPEFTWLHVACGFILILGHSKSVFLNFKGGKSAMSSLGVITALSPLSALILGGLAGSIILGTRMVSIGSIVTAISAPIVMYVFHCPMPYVAFAGLASLLVVLRHQDNIKRLWAGTENKI